MTIVRDTAKDRTRFALAMWAGLILVAFVWGALLLARDLLHLDAFPPLHGHLRAQTWQLLPAVAVAAAVIRLLPRSAAPWRRLLLLTWACALAWAIALALSDGFGALAAPFGAANEYLPAVPAMGSDPAGWLRSFTTDLLAYPTHVKGHPPLPVLILWVLDRLGLHGPWPGALLAILLGTSSVIAVAITVRAEAGEEAARRALPYLALAPAAISVATSMDAVFLGVGAWGVALLALRKGFHTGFVAGLLLGALPYLSYGLAPYALLTLPFWRQWRPALLGAATVTAGFVLAGFWWPDGLAATRVAWHLDAGALRPYAFFLVGNVAVLALLTGPAVAAALTRRAPRPIMMLAGLAALGMLVLDLSGYTRGEVQRIWIPYAIWLMPLAAALPRSRVRHWLAAQAAVGILLQALLQSPW
ncbi:hypothetical protein J5X84_35520 [Streptosporangiaceae bacterium NEAU-GS5]|nr:hypothetical protein [Streptosporangiaceae bacterium NEAU-GS5]